MNEYSKPRLPLSIGIAVALAAAGLPVVHAGAVRPAPRHRGPSAADAERIAQAEAKRARKAAARVR